MKIKNHPWVVAGVVAFAVALSCAAPDAAPRKGAPCHHLGRTVAHGGHVLTCAQGPGRDEWTWQ